MSRERRTVRPYLGVDAVQSAISDIHLRIGETLVQPGASATVPVHYFLADKVELVLAPAGQTPADLLESLRNAVLKCYLDPADAVLTLVLSSSGIKEQDAVWTWGLDSEEPPPRTVQVGDANVRPRPLRTPFSGCKATFYIALARDLEGRPLRPSRKGVWLAKNEYRIATELGDSGWRPVPLTDDDRERLELHPSTLRFIEVTDVLNPETDPEDAIVMYIDEQVLGELSAHINSPGARHLQLDIFLRAMAAVVHAASRELESGAQHSFSGVEDSVLGRLLTSVCRSEGVEVTPDFLWGKLRTEPELVVAYLEGSVANLRQRLVAALGKVDS